MSERSLMEIARAAVAEIAPAELPAFDVVAQAHTDAPSPARRAHLAVAGEMIISLVLAVGADLRKAALLRGVRTASRQTRLRWARFRDRSRSELDSVPLPVSEADAAQLETAAVAAARERGAPEDLAEAVGSALARQWPRLP